MGNTLKLISGFILFVVGVLIIYEANVYNLIDILLVVGFIIAIVGIIMIISYFVDANADRTSSIVKEFLESNDIRTPSFNKNSDTSNGPLKLEILLIIIMKMTFQNMKRSTMKKLLTNTLILIRKITLKSSFKSS